MTSSNLENLILEIYKVGGIKFGQYTLKTGILSPVYIDIRCIVSFPKLMNSLIDVIWETMQSNHLDGAECCELLAGVPYTALPIASGLSLRYSLPMVIVRKERKAYGTGREVEGVYQPGQKCLIIEDVVTSGSSILESREKIERDGLIVKHAVVFIDRNQGGAANLSGLGVQLTSVTNLVNIVEILTKHNCITEQLQQMVLNFLDKKKPPVDQDSLCAPPLESLPKDTCKSFPPLTYGERAKLASCTLNRDIFHLIDDKQSNLCVAVDTNSKYVLLQIAELVGPDICILKVHIDMIEDFDMDLVIQLQALSKKHRFFIFEDRKFADIGNTVKQQYLGGIYKISDWAHLITAHLISGGTSIKALSKSSQKASRGILLIAQMSTSDNLLNQSDAEKNQSWISHCLQVAGENASSVSGFICQARFADDPKYIYYIPGVNISSSGDTYGQSYKSPETAIFDHGGDIIIVGRGILEAPNIAEACKTYRQRGWSAYLKRITCI